MEPECLHCPAHTWGEDTGLLLKGHAQAAAGAHTGFCPMAPPFPGRPNRDPRVRGPGFWENLGVLTMPQAPVGEPEGPTAALGDHPQGTHTGGRTL